MILTAVAVGEDLVEGIVNGERGGALGIGYHIGGGTVAKVDIKLLTRELKDMQSLHRAGTLLDDAARVALRESMEAAMKSSPGRKAYVKVFSKDGMLAKMKKLGDSNALSAEQIKLYNRQVEKHVVNQYEVLGKEAMNLPGDIADPKTLRGAYVKHFTDLYDDVYNSDVYSREGHKIIMERTGTLLKGVTVGNTWKPDERKKLMIAALVGSYLAMRTDADLEKYGTCGGGKMCLHFPMLFGKDNNEPYEQAEPLTQNYAGLVMGALPALGRDKVDRFHIMSPCKTDLVVEAHEDGGFCKCDEFYKHDSDEIVYKMQKVRCVSDKIIMKRTVPINADGTCPETYIRTGGNKIKMKADELEKTHEGQNTFSCDISGVAYDDINEVLEKCKYEFMHRDGCVDDSDTDYDDCIYTLYRDCYFDPDELVPRYPGTDTEGNYFCDNDQEGLNCDENGCIGMHNSHYTVPFSKHQDTFAIPVNAKENVNTGVLEPISVCTNSWSSEFLDGI